MEHFNSLKQGEIFSRLKIRSSLAQKAPRCSASTEKSCTSSLAVNKVHQTHPSVTSRDTHPQERDINLLTASFVLLTKQKKVEETEIRAIYLE